MLQQISSDRFLGLIQHAAGPGLAITIWPYKFDADRYRGGHIILPPVPDVEVYLVENLASPDWLSAVYLYRGDPAEPTKARWLARQLAREMRSWQYAWLHQRRVHSQWGRQTLRCNPAHWLYRTTQAVGLIGMRWYTTST